ncbi:MAG TPA: MOSC domain-containing protein [Thermoplasmata archaeon]|nr:MOSC domain-containing protein [Thermoplasmata archaeon]
MAAERSVAGTVHRLGAKPRTAGEHGLPKPELDRARITFAGVEGDYNLYRDTRKRGDPEMALLLLPLETIEELGREGWPVRPGDLGENVTTSGIAYARLAPPTRLRLGTAVIETARPCEPCDNLFLLPYVGRDRGPEFLKATLGRRGWFARVLSEGVVRRGDPVEAVGPA